MPPHEQAQKYLDKANQLAAQHQFNAAFTQFEIAIRRQYRNARAHIYFGYALVNAGKYPESIEQFRKAIEFDPAEPLIVGQLVEAFYRDSRQEQDLEEFQKVVDKADRADLYHTWAQVLSNLQRGDRAIKEFKKALVEDPTLELITESAVKAFNESETIEQQINTFQETADKLKHPHAWNSWGQILLGLGRYAAAAKQFEMAANDRKDWTTPYINWARALFDLTDYEQAIEVAKKALRCDERSLDAYLTIGRALDQMGEHEQAACNYAAGAAYGPTNEYFFYWLQSLNKLSDPNSAIGPYRLALEKSELTTQLSDWSPYVAFGAFLKELGRLPESAFQFGNSLAVDHDYYPTAELQEALSDLDDRQPTLDELQHLFDTIADPARLAQWAQVLARINEVDRAKKQLIGVVEYLPDRPWHLNSLGDALNFLESPADRRTAHAQIERAIKETGDVQLEVQWANLLVNTFNEHQQALSLYKDLLLKAPAAPGLVEEFVKTLKSSPAQSSVISEIDAAVKNSSDAAVCLRWAQILTDLDRSKSAIDHLKRAVELDETYVDAHYQLGRFYSGQGTYTKACQAYEKTAQLDQEHPAAIQEWGTALLKNGRREEALEKYAQAVRARAALARQALSSPVPMTRLDTDSAAGDLISIVDRLTWNDDVIARFQKVFDEINDAQSYREWGIVLVKIKRPDRAIEQFKKAVDLDPDAHASFSEWLKAVGSSGLSAQRLAEYEQAAVKYSNNAVAYSELGDFLYRLKRMEQAAQKYQRALELDPKNSRARGWLSYSFIAMNDIERARQEARQLVADDPLAGAAYDVLSWCAFVDGDYDEAVKQAELGISKNYFYLYDTCARALHKSGREDLAMKKFQEALEKHPDDIDLLYNYGAMLMEMNHYEEAAPVFEKVVQMKPDHVYANHNLAAIPFDKGRYEEAYVKWMHAVKIYKQQGSLLVRAIDQNRFVDSSEAYYYASVVLAIQHNPKDAENVINEGLEFDPNNTLLLRLMADLHWEKKEEMVGVDSEANRRRSEYHWRGMEHFQRAEKLLKERSKLYPNYYLLIELGDLYLLHEDYDKARQCFEEARTKDDAAYIPYAKLGVIYLRERQPDKAIPLLQEALKRNPDELDVKSSLAEAYLRAEKLDDAETTYRQVLAIAPNHVQSSIGLGELSSALGDKKDYDRYSEAIDHFTRALDVAENEKIRSKYLKKAEAAAVYYQLGYARVQSYESAGIRKDTKLLEQAKKAFDNCIARNPSHQKARRAKEKIDKRLEFFSRDRLTETHGPRAIFWMSIIVFIFVQVAFFAVPFFNQPSLIVSDRSLQAAAKQVPGAPVEKLSTIKNQEFSNHKTLSTTLQGLLPEDGGKLAEAVMQHVESVKRFENVPDLPAGYYALLTFGSLLFMVVGLYLPQILKLRVAGIELEKSSVDQAGAGGTLGISKL